MNNKILFEMIKLNGNDTKMINHSLKVYAFAECIIKNESTDAKLIETTCLAAVLHDIAIKKCLEKYNSAVGAYQEIEGPPIAEEILSKYYDDKDIIERVSYLIGHHHTYDNIKGLDYRALIEADFLVNLEEGKSSKDIILAARDKYFNTDMGIELISTMLL